jgi:hypothetical protein
MPPLRTGLCQNGYMSMKSEVRHFHSGSLEGRKAQQFRPLCSAALTIPTLMRLSLMSIQGGKQKQLPGGRVALFLFRLSSESQYYFLPWLAALIFNFL